MKEQSQFRLLAERRFLPFFLTQFFGAANDNVFKFAFTVLATYSAAQWGGMDPKSAGAVSNYALEGQDADALDDKGIRSLFKDEEFEHLKERVQAELLPRLDDVRQEWEQPQA